MQQSKRRGNRGQQFVPSIQMNNFSDLLKAKLEFKFVQGYSQLCINKKQQFWKQRLEQLLNQQQKILYWLPDSVEQKDVQLATSLIEKYYTQNQEIDYEYEKTFVTNTKKQLLIYRNCAKVTAYLSKYRLPKGYQEQIKKVSKDAQFLSETIIQRNEYISLGQDQKVSQLSKKVQELTKNFNKSFSKFAVLMQDIFAHFKQQKKREQIILIAIRQSIIQKLRELSAKAGLFLIYRFTQTDGDEFKDIIIKKIKDQQNDDDYDLRSQSSRKSSVIESSFQSQEQFSILPPKGIESVQLVKLTESAIAFKVNFLSRSKLNQPDSLIIREQQGKFFQIFPIKDIKQSFIDVQIAYSKKGYVQYVFETKNQAGSSEEKETIKLCLNLEESRKDQNQLILARQKSFYMIEGKDKLNTNGILPKQKSTQTGLKDIAKINLPATNLSISSTHVMICDSTGYVAYWGAIYSLPTNIQTQEQKTISFLPQAYNLSVISPFLLMPKQNRIVKVSCGSGYGLMLDIFGDVWSYGLNNLGQLGLGSQNQKGIQEPEIIKTFREFKCFIVDIQATESGASFAIDSEGMLYRWGPNQVDQSFNPVTDRFGSIINYTTGNLLLKQFTPIPVKKKYSNQKIVKVLGGNQFVLALNNNGDLYGWGQCYNLGIGKLLDKDQQEVQSICNPLQIMKGVQNISAGYDHAVAVLKDKTIKGWGVSKYFSNNLNSERLLKPVDLTSQYGQLEQTDIIECGTTYTAIYKKGQVNLYGANVPFENKSYVWNKKIHNLICTKNYIGFLSDRDQH